MSLSHRNLNGVGGFSIAKRTSNIATKAAAQRLANVMSLQNKDNDSKDDDKDHIFKFVVPSTINGESNLSAISFTRRNRSQSIAVNFRDLKILKNKLDRCFILLWGWPPYSLRVCSYTTQLSFFVTYVPTILAMFLRRSIFYIMFVYVSTVVWDRLCSYDGLFQLFIMFIKLTRGHEHTYN